MARVMSARNIRREASVGAYPFIAAASGAPCADPCPFTARSTSRIDLERATWPSRPLGRLSNFGDDTWPQSNKLGGMDDVSATALSAPTTFEPSLSNTCGIKLPLSSYGPPFDDADSSVSSTRSAPSDTSYRRSFSSTGSTTAFPGNPRYSSTSWSHLLNAAAAVRPYCRRSTSTADFRTAADGSTLLPYAPRARTLRSCSIDEDPMSRRSSLDAALDSATASFRATRLCEETSSSSLKRGCLDVLLDDLETVDKAAHGFL